MSQVEYVDRAVGRKYLKKAEEFLRSAEKAAEKEDWDATTLMAIHAGISATDAYLSWSFGQRSASKDHLDAVRLLMRIGGEAVRTQASALQRLLRNKNVVAFEDRKIAAGEARDSLLRARRLVAWAGRALSES